MLSQWLLRACYHRTLCVCVWMTFRSGGVFRDCLLAPPGTTVREFARMVDHQMEQFFAYAEGLSGQRVRARTSILARWL
jgi:hypothetical protein